MLKLKLLAGAVALVSCAVIGNHTLNRPPTKPVDSRQLECLASNIYHEARDQPVEGQLAVAQVTLNRVASGKFKNTVCKVVYSSKQFSWTNTKKIKVNDERAWLNSVAVAKAVLSNAVQLPNFNALYYHNTSVKPYWITSVVFVGIIGDHLFYA